MRLNPGQHFGPFEIIRYLGKGAYKQVWLAKRLDDLAGVPVALGLCVGDVDEEQIRREAVTWVRISGHPNVLPLLWAGVVDEYPALVSEYAAAGTLRDWLNEHGGKAPSVNDAVKMTCGILNGLDHLHSQAPKPVIHRDLKPGNVLLQGDNPRLTDFGLANFVKSSLTSNIVGTPAYMSPEMFEGRYSVESDLWAAGVLLYEMLTGRLPFGQSEMAIMQMARCIDRDPPHPCPEVPNQQVVSVLLRGFEKDPSRRYPSAKVMRDVLQEAVVTNTRSAETVVLRPRATSEASDPTTIIQPPSTPKYKVNPKDGAEMVWIPAGAFQQGSNSGAPDERPQRLVYIEGFWIYKYPVSVEQYSKFCLDTKRRMPPTPVFNYRWSLQKHPIVNIVWQDAQDYAEWAGMTLPSEAQWEKAARGTYGREYPWEGDWDVANCASSVPPNELKSTVPIGSHPQGVSLYGVEEMVGNVWQWCSDWYDPDYYTNAPSTNPLNTQPTGLRSLRGGCWVNTTSANYRCSHRFGYSPTQRFDYWGFRCVSLPTVSGSVR